MLFEQLRFGVVRTPDRAAPRITAELFARHYDVARCLEVLQRTEQSRDVRDGEGRGVLHHVVKQTGFRLG